jgi:hypothetical protein
MNALKLIRGSLRFVRRNRPAEEIPRRFDALLGQCPSRRSAIPSIDRPGPRLAVRVPRARSPTPPSSCIASPRSKRLVPGSAGIAPRLQAMGPRGAHCRRTGAAAHRAGASIVLLKPTGRRRGERASRYGAPCADKGGGDFDARVAMHRYGDRVRRGPEQLSRSPATPRRIDRLAPGPTRPLSLPGSLTHSLMQRTGLWRN